MTKTLRPRPPRRQYGAPDLSDYRIDVQLRSRIDLLGDCIDAFDYFSEFDATIRYSEDEREHESLEEPIVGNIDGFLSNYTAMCNAGETVFWSFDAIDRETHEAYCAVFSGECWSPWITEYLQRNGVQLPRHLLYLRFMELVPEHRGKGVGAVLLDRILRHPFIPSSTLVLVSPFAAGTDYASADGHEARAKVTERFESIGFVRVPKSVAGRDYYMAMAE